MVFSTYKLHHLPRILSIDYGLKRTGLAVTDPLKIIATGLTTIDSKELISFLKKYLKEETVELIIIGEPKNLDDTDTHATSLVRKCVQELEKIFLRYLLRNWMSVILPNWQFKVWCKAA